MNDNSLKWEPIGHRKLMAQHKSGFSIIVATDDPGPLPLACPLCSLLMKGYEDVMAYRRSSVCAACMCVWYDIYKQKWETGWRPSQNAVNQELKKRLSMPVYLVI